MTFQLISKNVHIDFLKYTRAAAMVSTLLVLTGFWALGGIFFGGRGVGIDFSGGTVVHIEPEGSHQTGELRSLLAQGRYEGLDIQRIQGTARPGFRIRMGPEAGPPGEAAEGIVAMLREAFPQEEISVPLIQEVGPAASKKLQRDALKAVGLALLGILAYIWLRFEIRYSVAAILAAMHDCLAALGLASLAGYDFNLLMVSALLIIMGYSLNDTVVIFDRIRENLRAKTGQDFAPMVSKSLNQVLARTVITGGTTFFVLLSLYFFGGDVLRGFALTLIVGVLVGTYSSIFLAPPLVIRWSR